MDAGQSNRKINGDDMMGLPEDWDMPSEDNKKLCKKFGFAEFDFDGTIIPYRYYFSETDEKIPLVVYLHGADAVGDDNVLPLAIHDIGTMFARDEWQKKHPCSIIAPQYSRRTHWSAPKMRQAILSLINKTTESHDNIDIKRIYIYGYSAGGVGTLRYVKDNPDLFAGAISICGATGKDNLEALTETPIWLIHAADDEIVRTDFFESGSKLITHYGSRNIYDAIGKDNEDIKYTEYPKGWMGEHYNVNPHCSWVVVSDRSHSEFSEWLFSQSLKKTRDI
ncbi:MAG: prolyl oligopeptidase family serine peptidase [Lachnospiraceae bacterium]|nr:prolyl oligopeptidase family serine peptidase [Lachnospiraceae bacterium]